MADQGESGGAEVLLAAQVWPAVLVPAGVLVALVAAGVWLLPGFPYFPVGILAGVVVLAWFQRGDALLADEKGLLLRHRGRVTRRYRWDEIHQAGLARPWFAQVALAVYPRGGPWDVPGPNSAVLVGRIWMLRGPGKLANGCTRCCAPGGWRSTKSPLVASVLWVPDLALPWANSGCGR